jgi:polycystin 1L2
VRKTAAKWKYVSLNYTFFAYYAGCYFFDSNIKGFNTDGCAVGKCSSPYATQCFCTHMTYFSNMFELPVIQFDITAVNINALNASPTVACFLVSIICAYLIVCIWARHADMLTEDRIGVVYLPDNDPLDVYAYEITVWTGNLPGCGTTANVSIILAGDDTETAPRWIYNPNPQQRAFKTGAVDRFLLTTNTWLGTMSHIRLWHDNTGSHPGWYPLRILIRDIYSNTKYYFLLNSWFAAEKGAGTVSIYV